MAPVHPPVVPGPPPTADDTEAALLLGQWWAEQADETSQRAGLVATGAVQLALAGTAWADLARRRPADVAGRKGVWAAVIAVDWVGPLAYLRWGRRR